MDIARHLKQLTSTRAENAYNRLTNYRFAQRYVKDKSVVDIGWEEVGYGTRLLAETAKSVVGLTISSEALDLASIVYSAPNASYQQIDHLQGLPYPEDSFDVAIALEVAENLEHPENLVAEAKRVLKQDGILIISTPDKQAYSNDRNYRDPAHRREVYVPEFRELLEGHFEWVSMYRQGAVAGGLVLRTPDGLSAASVESTWFYSTNPLFGNDPPITHFVMAVCSNAEIPEQGDNQPYLLLDSDRRIFDECEEHREDVQLLQDEIQHMQETEVQAFQDTVSHRSREVAHHEAQLKLAKTRIRNLRARNEELYDRLSKMQEIRSKNEKLADQNERLRGRSEKLADQNKQLIRQNENLNNLLNDRLRNIENLNNRLRDIESSRVWRLFSVYRNLRSKLSIPERAD